MPFIPRILVDGLDHLDMDPSIVDQSTKFNIFIDSLTAIHMIFISAIQAGSCVEELGVQWPRRPEVEGSPQTPCRMGAPGSGRSGEGGASLQAGQARKVPLTGLEIPLIQSI